MKDFAKLSRVMLVLGMSLYLLCLWWASPRLDDKGYFLAVLVLGSFAIIAHRQATTLPFARLCHMMLLLASGLLLVGVWNMSIALTFKGFSVAAWFACMYGISTFPMRKRESAS